MTQFATYRWITGGYYRHSYPAGNNPHVWLTVRGWFVHVGVNDRRCPCGMFEHERVVAHHQDGTTTEGTGWHRADAFIGDVPDRCPDPGCQREAGHPPPHRSRYYAGHGDIGEEEWEDGDRLQRYLDGDPAMHDPPGPERP